MNDELSGTYNAIIQIKFKTVMLKSGLHNYGDTSILSGTIEIAGAGDDGTAR